MCIRIHSLSLTEIFLRSYSALDGRTRAKVIETYTALLQHPIPSTLDLRPLGAQERKIFTILVEDALRISFKEIEGIAELRTIAKDENLDIDGYLV